MFSHADPSKSNMSRSGAKTLDAVLDHYSAGGHTIVAKIEGGIRYSTIARPGDDFAQSPRPAGLER